MNKPLKLIKIGNSTGIILPKDVLARIGEGRSARKAAIGWVVRMVLALLLIGLAVKLGLLGLVSQ